MPTPFDCVQCAPVRDAGPTRPCFTVASHPRAKRYWIVVRNPRVWIYLVVGLMAAGLIAYFEWRDSDTQRLQRCVDASITQMKTDIPALDGFDNAQSVLVEMSRASCMKQLGINPQTK